MKFDSKLVSKLECRILPISELSNAQDFFQSPVWARQKSAHSWEAQCISLRLVEQSEASVEPIHQHRPQEIAHPSQETARPSAEQSAKQIETAHPSQSTERIETTILLLKRRIFGTAFRMSIAYIPYAPASDFMNRLIERLRQKDSADGQSPPDVEEQAQSQTALDLLISAIRPHCAQCLYIRFDLNWIDSDAFGIPQAELPPSLRCLNCGASEVLRRSTLLKSPSDIQPPNTVILRIDAAALSQADLLRAMKPKTRYNIRLAEKRGVRVEQAPRAQYEVPKHYDQWYALYQQTEKRNRIAIHSSEYYARLFALSKQEQCRLYLAWHEGDLLAGIVVVAQGGVGRYLYGASSNHKRSLMPAYALQWRAICDLRSEGYQFYDLFGIPPSADVHAPSQKTQNIPAENAKPKHKPQAQAENPKQRTSAEANHPMQGLYRFKTGFSGTIIHYPGAWDLPLSPLYYLYRIAERLRMYYFRVFKKKLRSRRTH